MTRAIRVKSGTGIYHVMLRGINRQDIFEGSEDYKSQSPLILRSKIKKTEGRKYVLMQDFSEKIWNYQKKFLYLQRERRSQVEPRCAERWHGCSNAEMMSNSTLPLGFLHLHTAGHVWPAFIFSYT